MPVSPGSSNPRSVDVAIVGGGIAGGALAVALARAGTRVLVLERDEVYRDRAVGEFLPPWGVAEAAQLGVEDVLLGAGGGYVRTIIGYDEVLSPTQAESHAVPLGGLLPGVRGAIGVGHPQACEALARAATAAGAHVVRGVTRVEVTPGQRPEVAYVSAGVHHTVAARVLVGADGRGSVVRRTLGRPLRRTRPATAAVAALVEGVTDWPEQVAAVGTERDLHFLVFPRPAGFVRLALLHDVDQRARFTGKLRNRSFLDAIAGLRSLPQAARLAAARLAGPCLSYAMNDTWVAEPGTSTAVLVGDAAGWSDPIIGQGLAVALRDARLVRDRICEGWTPAAFASYAQERDERMRRLRTSSYLATQLRCTFTPAGVRRRAAWFQARADEPLLGAAMAATLIGPQVLPAEAFAPATVARILRLGPHEVHRPVVTVQRPAGAADGAYAQ